MSAPGQGPPDGGPRIDDIDITGGISWADVPPATEWTDLAGEWDSSDDNTEEHD